MRASAAALLVAMAAVGIGCGGDSDEESGPPTRAEYVEQGDEICQELYEQRDPLEAQAAEAGVRGDDDEAAGIFENAADITENRVADLEALEPPAGDEEAASAFVESAEATIEPAREAAEALRQSDDAALERAGAAGARANTRFAKSSERLGFLVCGRGAATTIG